MPTNHQNRKFIVSCLSSYSMNTYLYDMMNDEKDTNENIYED